MIKKVLKVLSIIIASMLVLILLATFPNTLKVLLSQNDISYKLGYLSSYVIFIVITILLFKFGFSSKK